jgi:hypothetical protein
VFEPANRGSNSKCANRYTTDETTFQTKTRCMSIGKDSEPVVYVMQLHIIRLLCPNVLCRWPCDRILEEMELRIITFSSHIVLHCTENCRHKSYILTEDPLPYITVDSYFIRLKPKLVYVIFKNSVHTSKRTPNFTITNINFLTLS